MRNYFLYLSIALNIVCVTWILTKHFSAVRNSTRNTANDSMVTFTYNKYKVFDQRKDFFKENPIHENDIVFAGNSLIENFQVADMLGRVKNRGMSGDNTRDLLNRVGDIISGKPSKVFIMEGINDIGQNIPEDEMLKNFKEIIGRIQRGSPKTSIYIYSILPVLDKKLISHIKTCNKRIEQICTDMHVQYIDLFTQFYNGSSIKPDLTLDGIHLNAKGYVVWYKSISKPL